MIAQWLVLCSLAVSETCPVNVYLNISHRVISRFVDCVGPIIYVPGRIRETPRMNILTRFGIDKKLKRPQAGITGARMDFQKLFEAFHNLTTSVECGLALWFVGAIYSVKGQPPGYFHDSKACLDSAYQY